MTLAPTSTPIPPLYFVERSFGKHGNAFVETSRDSNSRKQIISDIISGQTENVLRILEVFEDEGTCRDVTEDVARECRDQLDQEWNGVPDYLRDFIDGHCGISTCDQLNASAGRHEDVYQSERERA